MNTLLQEAYARAQSANYLYTRHRDRYVFLLNSYVGGDEYRKGQYLYRYQLETNEEYARRLQQTPLDNQCKSVISLYNSFLFRTSPVRELGVMEDDIRVEAILADADLDGRSMDQFMREVAVWSQVFGHCWCAISKPSVNAVTLADEMAQGVRPYLSVYSPLAVTDWRWARQANGGYKLSMIKYLEEINDTLQVVKEWTETEIITTVIDTKRNEATEVQSEPNELGMIPFVQVYAERSPVRGIGLSVIDDIADQQRMMYNESSEIYESIRLDTHPSLVASQDTDIGSGAGSLIRMPDNMAPDQKPYLLEFSGAPVASIYNSITERKKMIDSMANVGSARGTETSVQSGVAIELEQQLLNARLSLFADNLELAEEQIWQLVAGYLGYQWTGEIKYADSFMMRDTGRELAQLISAYGTVQNPQRKEYLEHEIMEIVADEDPVTDPESVDINTTEQHTETTTANRAEHIQTMIMEGYEDSEILAIHPEITSADILSAKQSLLNL